MNGNIILKKRLIQFHQWVLNYNNQYSMSINPIIIQKHLSLENPWLTGFADAEGSFNIQLNVRKETGKNRLRIRFYLDQAYSFDCLKSFIPIIGGCLTPKTRGSTKYYRLTIDSFSKIKPLLDYFSKNPPQTNTLLVRFIRARRVFIWYSNKEWTHKIDSIKHLIKLNKHLSKRYSPIKLSKH